MRQPEFFIVGAPKCGTTAIYTYLRENPGVFMPDFKEPHFFGSDLDFPERQRFTIDEYLKLFEGAQSNQRVGEASVFYLMSKCAAQEISDFDPNARILIMLRNPVDMMHSFHSHRVFNGTEQIEDFAAALEAESEREHGRLLPPRLGLRQGLYYRALSNFSEQIARYRHVFPKEQIHVIIFEEFLRDPGDEYRKLCEFLNVDSDFTPNFRQINENRVTRVRWLRSVSAAPPRIFHRLWRAVPLNVSTKRKIRSSLLRLNAVNRTRTQLDPVLRHELQREAKPQVLELSEMLGKDLSSIWLESR